MLDLDEIRRHLQYMVLSRVEEKTGLSRYKLERIVRGQDVHVSAVRKVSAFLVGLRDDE